MNRSDLINFLKDKNDLGKRESEKIITTFFNAISESLADGDRAEIRGFGSFTVKRYKSYTGRNPKSGKKIKVPSKKLPFFKVGKGLKDMVDK